MKNLHLIIDRNTARSKQAVSQYLTTGLVSATAALVLSLNTYAAMDESHDMKKIGHDMSPMSMQGGSAPDNARDPDAYSGGYTLDSAPYAITGQDKLSFADEHSRWFVSFDRLEYAYSKDNERLNYDGRLVWGRDYNKVILTSEGKVDNSKLREASTELLWSHAVDTFWDGQIGVRYDSGDEKDQTWLTAGFQGLAPYWFEIDAKASVSTEGQTALDIEAEYELLLTQRLILQPRLEMSIYGKDDAERGIASGFSSLATGLRLRYEFSRQFAPYVGVEWESKLGDTRELIKMEDGETEETFWLAGIRFWF
ncbi:copper resistance protein B [Photobacterium profundum]|uniref:Hypothetical copper resistance protein B n=1 Tax=Photobacterium profundum (strain SS9) TaxID=298386 RepID=Q6LTI3_PHOPR|nr:copper resistance protein B [Photobacterium profundum]CAG19393.1 hypothetical copper resistance protein B precursor [Photobacterium profundum SS9]